MSKEIMEIRSNISASFLELERLRIEREERETKERNEKWNREQEERTKKADEWSKAHANLYKYTYASYYNKDSFNYDYGISCKIHFYEWSNVDSNPIIFEHYARFYDFLDRCDIFLENDSNNNVRSFSECFISCKPGSKDLIISKTYDELKRKMYELENLAKMLAPVPEVNSANT